jgi:hypothetical protein
MILSFRVVLSLEDKAPPEAVTFFNPAFPNGAGFTHRARWRPASQHGGSGAGRTALMRLRRSVVSL